ncbi:MAG: hypothetical protein ABSC25_20115 [Roseiarcus sp.]|jgi:hypothetical protein
MCESHRVWPVAGVKTLRNFDARDGCLGLLEWAEPVIFDRLRDVYRRRVADGDAGWALARLHCRVWRALIAGDTGRFESLRGELLVAMRRRGLDLESLVEADAQTMNELVEIVIARFQRSERVAKAYHLALIELAARLARAGRAA